MYPQPTSQFAKPIVGTTGSAARFACPLCSNGRTVAYHRDARRQYFRCGECQLVFVPPKYFLSAEEEKHCYDQHQNDPADAAYRRFLGRLFGPLIERLAPGAWGLDFGSGPGPTLSVMLTEAGFPTAIYDPFYAPDASVWRDEYDFITASEVVEHLHHPMAELQRLWSVLRPSGWLGIMTKRVHNAAAFAEWHYKNDPTHVVFFADATFAWLASHWSAGLEIVGPDVALLQKPGSVAASDCLASPRGHESRTVRWWSEKCGGQTPLDQTWLPWRRHSACGDASS